MPIEAQFTFMPLEKHPKRSYAKKDNKPEIIISPKNGTMTFNRPAVDHYEVTGKKIRLFYDEPKKAIGFQFVKSFTLTKDKQIRGITFTNSNTAVVSAAAVLSVLGVKKDIPSFRCQIKEYKTDALFGP